jgi:adenine-specific DNA-methyltransferase
VYRLRKGEGNPTGVVELSTNDGASFDSLAVKTVPESSVVKPDDPDRFIHLAMAAPSAAATQASKRRPASLTQLGLAVSTGRVVQYRARAHLQPEPQRGSIPLLHAFHLDAGRVTWPVAKARKPQALRDDAETRALALPRGNYVVVRRFSSKEEKRRIVAATLEATDLPHETVAVENHLNVFHAGGRGLPLLVARGLTAFLSSTAVDEHFREFNGHTQVNATDLRRLNYPRRDRLVALGRRMRPGMAPDQVDRLIAHVVLGESPLSSGASTRKCFVGSSRIHT